ncbi:uncharacterized protein VTP21DRAFT_9475 [Calcarisporiella thermophila]|uniref:uncharacterized protein n=1 Tax=Calcarisporiella thermophila TaxID=911321 RepID=UPI0037444F7D
MKFFLLSLPLLLATAAFGCERECRDAISHAFSDNYTPKIREEFSILQGDLNKFVSVNPQHAKLTTAVNNVIKKIQSDIGSGLVKRMDKVVFDKYRGHCDWTLGEVCGSPVSVSYHVHDVLERTRGAIKEDLINGAALHGDYENAIISAAVAVLGDQEKADQLQDGVRSALAKFRENVDEHFCEEGCWDNWVPGIRKILAQYP